MAFNPFHSFRKHRRVLFAGLTILCMLTFVMTAGVANTRDIFSFLPMWLGGGGRNPQVAKVFNKTVKVRDLEEVRQQRRVANALASYWAEAGLASFEEDVGKDLDKPTAPLLKGLPITHLEQVRQAAMRAQQRADMEKRFQDPRLAQFKGQFLFQYYQQVTQDLPTIQQAYNSLEREQKDEAEGLRDFVAALELERWTRSLALGLGEFYFGGGLEPESLLDFIMWRQEADRLGIQFTDKDLAALVNREFLNSDKAALTGDSKDDVLLKNVQKSFPELRDWSRSNLYQAMADEFRAAMAQAVLLGSGEGVYASRHSALSAVPAPVTPFAFWSFFRDHRTRLTVKIQPVPVSDFPVAKQPTERDIQSLYEQFKDRERSPESDKPGFKVPSQAMVQWVGANPDSPHYRDLGNRIAATAEVGTRLSLAFTDASAGSGPAFGASLVALATVPNLRVLTEYADYTRQQPGWTDGWWQEHESTSYQPEVLARMLGQRLGSAGTGGSELTVPSTFAASVIAQEVRTRAHVNLTAWLTIAGPTRFTAPALAQAVAPMPLPLPAVIERLLQKSETDFARQKAASDVDLLRKELYNLYTKPKEAREWVTKHVLLGQPASHVGGYFAAGTSGPLGVLPWVELESNYNAEAALAAGLIGTPSAGLEGALPWLTIKPSVPAQWNFRYTEYHTTGLRHRFNITQDPEAQKLWDLWKRQHPYEPEGFADLFFGGGNNAAMRRQNSRPPLYFPSTFPVPIRDTESILYWTVEEKDAYVPKLSEVRQQVVDVWKSQQARQVARAEAERIKKEIEQLTKGQPGAPGAGQDVVRPLYDAARAHPQWGDPFDLTDVARLVPAQFAVPGHDSEYHPYEIPQHERESRFRYPRPNLVEDLIKSLKKDGDVAIISDQPESVYYVVVLVRRTEATEDEFYSVYSTGPTPGGLWQIFDRDRRKDFREETLKQLRIDAGLLNEDGSPNNQITDQVRERLKAQDRERNR